MYGSRDSGPVQAGSVPMYGIHSVGGHTVSMGSSPARLCRSLLLLAVSSCLLQSAVAYTSRSRPVAELEDGLRLRFGGQADNLPTGSNADAASLEAPSAASSTPAQQEYATVERNFVVSLSARVSSASPAATVHVAVEKDFHGAPLGQVISASPPDKRSPSPDAEVAQETETVTEGAVETEDVEESQSGIDTEDAGGEEGFQSSGLDPDVSPLGVFVAPRPDLSGLKLSNRPMCQTKDGTQGVCHTSPVSCQLLSGSFSHKCAGDNGVCCVFEHSCSTFTRERVSYYRNPGFPLSHTGNLVCNYKVKIAPNVCGIRAEFLNYTTPITSECSETQLVFLVGDDTRSVPLCGILTGVSMMFEVKPRKGTELVISHVLGGKEPYLFNIRLTQVLCSSVKPIQESSCGRRNSGMVRHKRESRLQSDSVALLSNADLDTPFELEMEGEDDLTAGDQLATRVVGGRESGVNEWPWQVALFKRPTKTSTKVRFFCGGTLISKEYLLTAAHCVSKFKGFKHTDMRDHVIVALGDHNIRLKNESKAVYRKLKRFILHPLYDPSRNAYDIALLQLSSAVSFSGAIAPACLPDAPRSLVGEDLYISGWGVVSFNGSRAGPTSAVLKTAAVKSVSREECDEKWKKFDNPGTVFRDLPPISERQGCADNTPGAACFGDSGGPVTFKEENGRFTLLGAVSFGPPICKVGGEFPTIYTRVAAYISWIRLAVVEMF